MSDKGPEHVESMSEGVANSRREGLGRVFASPRSMGGWLCIGGVCSHFFERPFTDSVCEIYGNPAGTSDGQQTWECMAILVAIDIRATLWDTERIILKARGDNIGALTLVINMCLASPAIATIACELARNLLRSGCSAYTRHRPWHCGQTVQGETYYCVSVD